MCGIIDRVYQLEPACRKSCLLASLSAVGRGRAAVDGAAGGAQGLRFVQWAGALALRFLPWRPDRYSASHGPRGLRKGVVLLRSARLGSAPSMPGGCSDGLRVVQRRRSHTAGRALRAGGIQSIDQDLFAASYHLPVHETIELGATEVPRELFDEFIAQRSPAFTASTYNLMTWNCNNFTVRTLAYGHRRPPASWRLWMLRCVRPRAPLAGRVRAIPLRCL